MHNNYIFPEKANELNNYFENKKILILADAASNGYCVPVAKKILPNLHFASLLVLPNGEANKNIDTVTYAWQKMQDLNITRDYILVNIGGGVLCDMGGFIGSTYNRGLTIINIPTTLLAMIDAGFGGKTGINFKTIKNFIGSFYEPAYTYFDTQFLTTLSARHITNGIAEIVKHAMISDIALWQEIVRQPNQHFFYSDAVLKKSIAIKTSFITNDFRDNGDRQALNFGHTIGHAIEAASAHTTTPLLHGEAIILGMLAETYLSKIIFNLNDTILQNLKLVKAAYYNNVLFNFDTQSILYYLHFDKKNTTVLNFSLIKNIADPRVKVPISEQLILDALNYLKQDAS
jgi:3-dehydroquinate synthase